MFSLLFVSLSLIALPKKTKKEASLTLWVMRQWRMVYYFTNYLLVWLTLTMRKGYLDFIFYFFILSSFKVMQLGWWTLALQGENIYMIIWPYFFNIQTSVNFFFFFLELILKVDQSSGVMVWPYEDQVKLGWCHKFIGLKHIVIPIICISSSFSVFCSISEGFSDRSPILVLAPRSIEL